MEFRYQFLFILVLSIGILTGTSAQSTGKYNVTPYPDLWYNDVDGARIGFRLLGEMDNSFKDGPHRLDLGLWVGTKLPDNPISYYVSFTEPITSLGSYANEANVELVSTMRDGYEKHGVFFKKRWQTLFNELNHTEVSIGLESNEMSDSTYRSYPATWDENEHLVLRSQLRWNREYNNSRTLALINGMIGVNESSKKITLELLQSVELSPHFKIRGRLFTGFMNDDIQPQEAFGLSFDSPINWLNNGITRSKGTIPMSMMDSGNFQVAGGANLRGYLQRDIEQLMAGNVPLFSSIQALNLEVEFWNPINHFLSDINIIKDLSEFRSYLFFDVGRGVEHDSNPVNNTANNSNETLADGGIGFQYSLNIPDYLGKDRALFIRYDLPVWVSNPADTDSNFQFRQLIGLGAIFSF